MTTWIIEPHDPLIARDGRPFGPSPGARAESLPFPYPSTTTGGVRTRAGQHENNGIFPAGDQAVINRVLDINVCGPLLVELAENGELQRWLFPAPADALLFRTDKKEVVDRQQLVPIQVGQDVISDLDEEGMAPVGLVKPDPRKPARTPPRYWTGKSFTAWLEQPVSGEIASKELGVGGTVEELRLHVGINPATFTGEDGALFLTSGREFKRSRKDYPSLDAASLALAVETAASMDEGLAPLGGERRLMHWRKSQEPWPKLPGEIRKQIIGGGACRLVLLTPGLFDAGYRPGWLLQNRHGLTPLLKAVAVQRPQVISGWDYALGKAKPTRRLAPAGTVYFLELGGDDAARAAWVDTLWMSNISDKVKDRGDGFGLAALGTWSGDLESMEVQK